MQSVQHPQEASKQSLAIKKPNQTKPYNESTKQNQVKQPKQSRIQTHIQICPIKSSLFRLTAKNNCPGFFLQKSYILNSLVASPHFPSKRLLFKFLSFAAVQKIGQMDALDGPDSHHLISEYTFFPALISC